MLKILVFHEGAFSLFFIAFYPEVAVLVNQTKLLEKNFLYYGNRSDGSKPSDGWGFYGVRNFIDSPVYNS